MDKGEAKVMLIEHSARTLNIPTETFMAWGQPTSLVFTRHPDDPDRLLISIPQPDAHQPATLRSRLALRSRIRRLAGRSSAPPRPTLQIITLIKVDALGGLARFSDDQDLIPDGTYLPANYHPMYMLCPFSVQGQGSSASQKADANRTTWTGITGYHEHLPLAKQNDASHAVSSLLVDMIASRLDKPSTILELGCGAGRNLCRLSKAFPSADIVGIEINPNAASALTLPENVRIQQGDVLSLDWETLGPFDVILTAGFLMHINHSDVRPLMFRINESCSFHVHWELHGPSYAWD
nr:class I SAM-dependent methyltransferase [Actinomycetota bacterium]